MRIYLDDCRPCPEGWTLCKTVGDMMVHLTYQWGKIETISLDNDLGEGKEGYTLLDWLEEQVSSGTLCPEGIPEITVHSANPVARARMQTVISRLRAFKG